MTKSSRVDSYSQGNKITTVVYWTLSLKAEIKKLQEKIKFLKKLDPLLTK